MSLQSLGLMNKYNSEEEQSFETYEEAQERKRRQPSLDPDGEAEKAFAEYADKAQIYLNAHPVQVDLRFMPHNVVAKLIAKFEALGCRVVHHYNDGFNLYDYLSIVPVIRR